MYTQESQESDGQIMEILGYLWLIVAWVFIGYAVALLIKASRG